jgi:hypothetical protein
MGDELTGLNQGARARVINSHLWEVKAEGYIESTNGIGPCPIRVVFDDGSSNIYAADELREV